MSFVNWVIDHLSGSDVIDLYFILSDLIDIDISPAEKAQMAHYDASSGRSVAGYSVDSNRRVHGPGLPSGGVPVGKAVL